MAAYCRIYFLDPVFSSDVAVVEQTERRVIGCLNPNISPFPSAKIGFIPFRNNFDKHTRSPIGE